MKKSIKIIVPLVLALVVIISVCWYLFRYDRGFTQDFLLQQARISDERGHHRLSTWYYDLAYRHSGEDETVAIELAEQFKAAGNYTKAEYTLSNAISDGGTAQLYLALCKTYVEQDKLLDAVTMLDNIANPEIKAELDAQRPQMPEATPADGYYNEYINVSLKSDGVVYITTDGEYPSIHNEAFNGELPLDGGETTIYALAVGENGLVSPLRVLGYTIAGVIEEVTISDEGLNNIIRTQLDVSTEHTLFSNQLWNITALNITDEVTDLSELAMMPFLETLTISQGSYENISAISTLANLKSLSIDGVTLTSEELTAIASLPDLTSLALPRCNLSSITELSAAIGLTKLDLSSNTIRDLEPLAKLTELNELNLSHNAVTQLTALTGAVKLTDLDVSYNSISSTVALSGCKNLIAVNLDYNALTKLEGLNNLALLSRFSAAHNQLSDISCISGATALTELDLSNNALTELSAIAPLIQLKVLKFANNRVTALPAFSAECQLSTLDGSRNRISQLEPLGVLSVLNYLTMDYNSGVRSLAPLGKCYNLVEVSVYGTSVTDVSTLTKMNVIVKYAPVAVN